MSLRTNIVRVMTEEDFLRCQEWVSKTELKPVSLDRTQALFAVQDEAGEIAAVLQLGQIQQASMFFDRNGPAMQTYRIFEQFKASIQVLGKPTIVVVANKSPLAAVAPKLMEHMTDGKEVYRV